DVREAYFEGRLSLIPCPGSLVFWGAPPYLGLAKTLKSAIEIPLLQLFDRVENPHAIRIPQSGWMHEAHPGALPSQDHGPYRSGYKRTHRWARVHRDVSEIDDVLREDKVSRVLFSTDPGDLGLYGKPMARNAQIWTGD